MSKRVLEDTAMVLAIVMVVISMMALGALIEFLALPSDARLFIGKYALTEIGKQQGTFK